MQSLALKNRGIVKFLTPRFIVDDAVIGSVSGVEQVDTVDKAGNEAIPFLSEHLDRRQRAAAHERKLGVDGPEIGITKLTPDIGHNLTYLSPASVEQIGKALAA